MQICVCVCVSVCVWCVCGLYVCVCVCVWSSVGSICICILCKTRPVLPINNLFSAVNFLYSKVFSVSNVKDKHFCMVSLFERENAGFKITLFSAYPKHGLPGYVLNQFCITRRYCNAGIPVCVFLTNQLLGYCSYASLTLI
jgi:hypothetical protein